PSSPSAPDRSERRRSARRRRRRRRPGATRTTLSWPSGPGPRSRRQSRPFLSSFHFEDGEKGLLGDIHPADSLHPLLSLLLFLQELALARDVAAVALREDVLSDRRDRLARDDLGSDGRLNHDFK